MTCETMFGCNELCGLSQITAQLHHTWPVPCLFGRSHSTHSINPSPETHSHTQSHTITPSHEAYSHTSPHAINTTTHHHRPMSHVMTQPPAYPMTHNATRRCTGTHLNSQHDAYMHTSHTSQRDTPNVDLYSLLFFSSFSQISTRGVPLPFHHS